MAKIVSEDDQVKSSFELIILKDKIENRESISWLPYKIVLQSAEKKLTYEKENNDKGAGDYVFALKPINEIENIISGIKSFLLSEKNENKSLYSFEPVEPSFELIIERTHKGKGYSVTCWIDAGNVISDHYSWDAFGLRFFTVEKNISSFVKELEKENA